MADQDAARSSRAAGELVDVMDAAGTVIRSASRAEVREKNLLHRSVFIAVVTSAGDVVVHQRAAWKDVWPSYWDICFGGVVAAGEDDKSAARREVAEEAGVKIEAGGLEDLGAGRYEDHLVQEIGRVFLVRDDGPFTFADGEVARVDRVAIGALSGWLDTHDVCPDSRELVAPRLIGVSDPAGPRPTS